MDISRMIIHIEGMQPIDKKTLLQYLKQGATQGFGDTVALYFGGKSDLYFSVENNKLNISVNNEKLTASIQDVLKNYNI